MRLLLDTCTFLWIVGDAPELSSKAQDLFSDPKNEVYLSAASAWEIGVKYNLGRLPLPEPPDSYVVRLREEHDIAPIAIDEASALKVVHRPDIHKDPFDRMLICQAQVHEMVLLTPDGEIAKYPVSTLW